MALSLTAEQKSILTIFSGNNQYIIPPYQRQYSWQEEQCSELFEDLKRAFDVLGDNDGKIWLRANVGGGGRGALPTNDYEFAKIQHKWKWEKEREIERHT